MFPVRPLTIPICPQGSCFSSRSACSRRMMGSEEEAVTSRPRRRQPSRRSASTAHSPRPSSVRGHHVTKSDAISSPRSAAWSGSCGHWCLLAPAERRAVHPHPMQDDGELAGGRDDRTPQVTPAGDGHAPRPQSTPTLRAAQQSLSALVERRPHHGVAAFRDAAVMVRLTRGVAPGCQAKVRTDGSGAAKPIGNVDGRLECQGDNGALSR